MDPLPPIPGEDPAFLDTVEHISRLAPIEKSCLVVGERGTGKELFTTRLHYLSARWERALIKVNCAALTESLLDSELFGHEVGAFTGASRRHIGCFERADGGTLVLDEIASASLAVQERILRVIEYGELQRVGGSETIEVDVRIVGASNVDLPGLAASGEFRADLLDRLAFDVVTLPPLRARRGDILLLARGFGLEITRELGREVFPGFSPEVEARLLDYEWPGNVRELKNVVERAVYRSAAPSEPIDALVIDPFDSPWRPATRLHPAGAGSSAHDAALGSVCAGTGARGPGWEPPRGQPWEPFTEQVRQFERGLLEEALTDAEHNQTAAAKALDLGYHQLRRLLKKHELKG